MDLLLPGFRFHPTEQELVGFYLKRMVEGKRIACDFIPKIDLYCYDPSELKGMMASSSEKEWYFFVPRDRKGGRLSRLTKCGYWKATGIDKVVQLAPNHSMPHHCYGLRKTLVYYEGRAPKGIKTEWIMNEYRLIYNSECNVNHPTMENLENTITLCKVYRKSMPLRLLLQASQFGNSTADEGPDIMKPCSSKLEEFNNLCSTGHDITKLPPLSQKSCSHALGLQALLYHKQEEATISDPPIDPSPRPSSSIAIADNNNNKHPDYQQRQHISIQPIIHHALQSQLARAADDDDGCVEIDLWSYSETCRLNFS